MRPLGDLITVKPDEKETAIGGITISVSEGYTPEKGIVLGVGEEVPEGNVKEGDHIVFRKAASTSVDIDGEKVLLMTYKSAYAVL